MFSSEKHPTEGETVVLRSSVKFGGDAMSAPEFSQPKGWENAKILTEMGFAADEIERLAVNGTLILGKGANG
jgi:hypothetical protein